jgi:hypothetical protein
MSDLPAGFAERVIEPPTILQLGEGRLRGDDLGCIAGCGLRQAVVSKYLCE